ncbi:hypothetical protein ACB094_08G168300 [Castanea mollissima]
MATLVGGAFLSATLQVLFDRMASQEEKEIADTIVEEWLDELKDAVYHAEDLLDEITNEALRCQVEADFGTSTSKVRNYISTSYDRIRGKLESKIQEVVDKLEYLASQINAIGLREGVEGRSSQRVATTSLLDPETIIYGRDDDEKAIVNMLLSNDVASNNYPGVIPIVGMGGVGKTTLARHIYNNQRVIDHFTFKAWVCVSEEFDVPKITKKILEAVSSQTYNTTDFNIIQIKLKDYLMGKELLLILDDVWNEKYDDWELLNNPFKYGTSGSRIIVTTRNESVALIICPIQVFYLNKLSADDCWLLFANYPFENGKSNAYPELKRIGEEIIKKCDGLPLAVKAFGCLLHSKLEVEEWNKILKSKVWSLSNGGNILLALRLSYNYLAPHLKRCFAYYSIFPKDYLFKKEELVQLWMGEGFLQQHNKNDEKMEVISVEYFLNLVSRSLLQPSNGSKLGFLMHDLVHDLAKSVSGKLCFRLEGDNTNNIIDKTCHFSYLRTSYDTPKKFEALCKAKDLRTFISLEMKEEDKDEDEDEEFYLTKKLQNVINSTNALNAKLKDKEHLKELTLEWEAPNDIISQSERDVLNNLQPHTSLTMLVIKNYSDTSFPNWVGDSSFSNITVVHLNSCRNCSSLPSLGHLPSLQDLFIFGFDEVVTVDADFYGSGSNYTIMPFQSLKILRFEAMSKWEEWSPYHGEGKDEGGAFPSLQKLFLKDVQN